MSIDTQAPARALTAQVARMIRERLGAEELTRADLARRLDVHETWVGKRLKGRTEISLSDLDRIAAALGVTIVDLLPRDRREVTLTFRDPSMARVVDHLRHRHGAPSGGRPSNRADRNGSPTRLRDASFVPRRLAA